MNPEVARLLDAINSGITQRGFYVLFDERLELICGEGCAKNPADPVNAERIKEFAAQHKLLAKVEEHGLTFRRAAQPPAER